MKPHFGEKNEYPINGLRIGRRLPSITGERRNEGNGDGQACKNRFQPKPVPVTPTPAAPRQTVPAKPTNLVRSLNFFIAQRESGAGHRHGEKKTISLLSITLKAVV